MRVGVRSFKCARRRESRQASKFNSGQSNEYKIKNRRTNCVVTVHYRLALFRAVCYGEVGRHIRPCLDYCHSWTVHSIEVTKEKTMATISTKKRGAGGSKRNKDQQGGRGNKKGDKEGGCSSSDDPSDKRQKVSEEGETDSPARNHQGAGAESTAEEGTTYDDRVHDSRGVMNG